MPSSYTLGPHFERFVKDQVAGGRYNNASEVLRDALRQLEERIMRRDAKLEYLRALIQEGVDSGDAGPLDVDAILNDVLADLDREAKAGVRDAA